MPDPVLAVKLAASAAFAVCLLIPTAVYFKKVHPKSKDQTRGITPSTLCCGPGSPDVLTDVCMTPECNLAAQRILNNMDKSVKPCNNFYKFACGNYMKNAKLEDDQFGYSAFYELSDKVDKQLRDILEEPPQKDEPRPFVASKQIYKLCNDEKRMDELGAAPGLALLEKAGGWPVLGNWKPKKWSWQKTEVLLNQLGLKANSLLLLDMVVDFKDSTRKILKVDQPHLPFNIEWAERGADSAGMKRYLQYRVDIAVEYGAKEEVAVKHAKDLLQFQMKLYEIISPPSARMGFARVDNRYILQDLTKSFTWVDWRALIQGIMAPVSFPKDHTIIVYEKAYVEGLEVLLKNTPPEVIANHMMWAAASDLSVVLTSKMRNIQYQSTSADMGTTSQGERWQSCVHIARNLHVALGAMYIRKHFDEKSKKKAVDLVNKLRDAVKNDIDELEWMVEETREHAKEKENKMFQAIAYPDELTDIRKIEEYYSDLQINAENYMEARLNVVKWKRRSSFISDLQPNVKNDWSSFSEVTMPDNIEYQFYNNAIVAPASVWQLPFFNSRVPNYLNYGAIGSVLAHEITHAFYGQGIHHDADGNVKHWWNEQSKIRFINQIECLVKQYNEFKVTITGKTKLPVDGKITLSENIADNAGVKLAYRAYQREVNELGKPELLLPGLQQYNGNKMFMIGMANALCAVYRPEYLQNYVMQDTHPPSEVRVNGAFMNMPEFRDVFGCKKSSYMNPKDKCTVW